MISTKVCTIEGCEKPRNTKGLCTTHQRRLRLWGDPLLTAAGTRRPGRATDLDRLLAKVDKNGPSASDELGPCWIWQASIRADGYGQFWFHNAQGTAHRGSYELHVGPIPDGLSVLHRCDTPTCVRPEHLFVGTQLVNMHDMIAKGRAVTPRRLTHCKYGHEYTAENTYVLPSGRHRSCRACRSRDGAERRAALRSA